MKCVYCKSDLSHIRTISGADFGLSGNDIWSKCRKCQTIVMSHGDNINYTRFVRDELTLQIGKYGTRIIRSNSLKPDYTGFCLKRDVLFRLDTVPEGITPQNAATKIQTLLLLA